MSEPIGNLLKNLILISEVDNSLARILAERKGIQGKLASNEAEIKKLRLDEQQRERQFAAKKGSAEREEKSVREEQQKLTARRKALNTLGSYKLQQAAEREIEHASRQLRAREEAVLTMMEEVEKSEAELSATRQQMEDLRQSSQKYAAEARETLQTLDGREKEQGAKRAEIAALIDRPNLSSYERISERHLSDAVVPVKNAACSGCFIQVAPQLLVQISRGDTLVKCRGCGRILYLDPADAPEQQGNREE